MQEQEEECAVWPQYIYIYIHKYISKVVKLYYCTTSIHLHKQEEECGVGPQEVPARVQLGEVRKLAESCACAASVLVISYQ